MKKLALAAALAAAVSLSFGSSHAGPRQAVYVASGLLATGVQTTGTPKPDTAFPADGKVPLFVEVDDAAGLTGFSVDVCQDKNGSGTLCDAGDAQLSYCSTGQKQAIPSTAGFVGSLTTTVFVNPDNLTSLVPCAAEGNTLAGTITLTT